MFESLLKTRWRIILTGTLIVAAPLLGLSLFVFIEVTEELEKLSIEKRQKFAFTAAHVLDERLQATISFGNAYAARPYLIEGIIKGDVKEINRHLKSLVSISRNIRGAFITSPKGILLSTYPASPAVIGNDYSYRDWYQGVSRNWSPYISEFYRTDIPPKYLTIAIAIPIRSPTGKVVAILGLLPKDDFIKSSLEVISQAKGETYLVDSKGAIIYHPDLSNDKVVNIASALSVKKVLQGLEGYEKGISPLTGKVVISGYHPVDSSGWGVITERPLEEVQAPVKEVTRGIYIFTAIMLLLGGWLAYRRSLLINRLNTTAKELELSIEDQQAMNEELETSNEELQCQQEELSESNRELLEATDRAEKATDRLMLAATAGGVGIWDYDLVEGILVWDDQMYRLYGIGKDDFSGVYEAWRSGLHPEDVVRRDDEVRMAISGEKDLNTEFRVVWPDGSVHNIRVMAVVRRDASGQAVRMVGTNWDITASRKAADELQEKNLQLAEVSRTKSDFLANMSHELRTPLNSVIGFSEVLLDQLCGPMNEDQQENVNCILSSGRHLLSLINDILDLSKVESGRMELELSAFPLCGTLNDSVMMLREKALKNGIKIHLEIAPEADVNIAADQRKLKQIMFNLLSNAVKFTPTGGAVDVTARRDSDFIEITVADTGIGIKTEDLSKLFQSFAQLESAYTKKFEGTGLGLALTRRLVELHGGRVWVESEFGVGSRFSFTMPVMQTM